VASSAFAYLALGPNNDVIWDIGAQLTGANAVAQAILTRLNLFLGEWWENLNIGLPVFQQMIGQLGSQAGLNAMRLAVQQVVAGTPYVTSAVVTQAGFTSGKLSFTVSAQTAFGLVTVSNAPGVGAALVGGA
jgi:hypothetical protein